MFFNSATLNRLSSKVWLAFHQSTQPLAYTIFCNLLLHDLHRLNQLS